MPNIKKFNEVQPVRSRIVAGLKTSALLAPLALSGLAGAQATEVAAMAADVQGGADAVQTAVIALVGTILVIAVIMWGSGKLRPKR